MYGFSPHSVEISAQRYALYFGTLPTEFEYDPKTTDTIKATFQSILQKLKRTFTSLILVGIVASFIKSKSFFPFASNIQYHNKCDNVETESNYGIIDYIQPGHIGNNLLAASKWIFKHASNLNSFQYLFFSNQFSCIFFK